MRVNLRQNNPTSLSIEQADESLIHLSNHRGVANGDQLYTGGTYVAEGTVSAALPTDGNKFELAVVSGTVTLTGGTVGGVVDAAIPAAPGIATYIKDDASGDWRILAGGGDASLDFEVYTSNQVLSLDERLIWMDSTSGPLTATLPDNLPVGTTFGIVRNGPNDVTVLSSGSEVIINPETGTQDLTGACINQPNRVAWFTKTSADEWWIARS